MRMTRVRVTQLLGLLFAASLLWASWLVAWPVHVYSVEGGTNHAGGSTTCGGSPHSVLQRDGHVGGEPLVDADTVAARCVAAAHERNELAVVAGALAAVTGGLLILLRRRDRAGKPGVRPLAYSFDR